MKKKLTCIVCPKGCEMTALLSSDGAFLSVSGHTCPRGKAYAESECTAPTRTLTATVVTESGKMLPVKTAAPIPKELLFLAMKELRRVTAPNETQAGDVLLYDIAGSGVALIATAHAVEV